MSRGTPHKAIRIDPDLWEQAKQVATDNGETLSEVIRRALAHYIQQHQ